jgi:hypothetical protein
MWPPEYPDIFRRRYTSMVQHFLDGSRTLEGVRVSRLSTAILSLAIATTAAIPSQFHTKCITTFKIAFLAGLERYKSWEKTQQLNDNEVVLREH